MDDEKIINTEDDVLFGNPEFLETHKGTQKWAKILSSYSRNYESWSDKVYQLIQNDPRFKNSRYLILEKKAPTPLDPKTTKFRYATEDEIEKRAQIVFQCGGGKKVASKRGRKRKHAAASMSSSDGENHDKNDVHHYSFQVGDDVFAFEQLWGAKIVKIRDSIDGKKVKLTYKGFRSDADSWVDELQILPSNDEMKKLYEFLDKSQKTHESDEEDDDDGDSSASEAEVVMVTPNGAKQKRGSTRKKTDEIELIPSSQSDQKKKKGGNKEDASIEKKSDHASTPTSPITKFLRESQLPPPPPPPTDDSTQELSQKQQQQPSLEHVVKTAKLKCKNALIQCNAAATNATIDTLLKGETAKWSENTISAVLNSKILSNLPQPREMEKEVELLKEQGGLKRLEALAMERNLKKWEKAQKHLGAFVRCLVDDL